MAITQLKISISTRRKPVGGISSSDSVDIPDSELVIGLILSADADKFSDVLPDESKLVFGDLFITACYDGATISSDCD